MLTSVQMAQFVAHGFLRFDEIVPREVNEAAIAEFEAFDYVVVPSGSCGGMIRKHYPVLFADDPLFRLFWRSTHPLYVELGVRPAFRFPHVMTAMKFRSKLDVIRQEAFTSVRCSIGVVMVNKDTQSVASIMSSADVAGISATVASRSNVTRPEGLTNPGP